jgi:methanethiol S-methyltransferase
MQVVRKEMTAMNHGEKRMIPQTDVKAKAHDWRAMMALSYGALCYLTFLSALLYSIGFIGDLAVPKSLDTGMKGSPLQAMIVDGLLLALFAVQHSLMARPAFKRWWVRFIPPSIERSTYVLLASLALWFLFWQWQPLPGNVWNITSLVGRGLMFGIYAGGWVIAVASTFLINHGDLFGLRQVFARWQARQYTPTDFKTPSLYRLVRHPLMVGFLLVFWAAPHMTWGHLLFAAASTGYILVGIHLEEHDLLAHYGAAYQRYRQQVHMILPLPKRPRTLSGKKEVAR